MKTKLLIWLLPAILIALSGDQAFACSVNPVAVLTITPYVYDSYLNRWYSPVGEVFFSGQASRDPDGGDPEIKLFEWNFGDGSSYSESPAAHADGEFDGITSHTYTAPGIYTITFKVTDNDADEGSPPDKSNTTTCTIAVVSVNLVVEGVPDNVEVTPGAFISYNNDDDNDEGTADNDETTVAGEDNLIKITLLVSPALGNYDGKVRLSVPYGQKDLRIWQNPDKGNLVLKADNGVYYKDWSPPDVPPNLYVEGYLLSGTTTLWLSHMKDALTIHDDTVNFRCVQLQVSSDASAPLDDWPKTATEIRSPKYIFGKEDPIYVQATNLGIDPGLAETKNNLVKVTSQSGGPVYLTLKETGLDSLYFNNVAALGELLYLSDADSDAGAAKIKVVDEEKLTFWLEIQPGTENYVSCYRVMLDRGEFATGAGRSYDSRLTPSGGDDRTPLWNTAADEFKNDILDSDEGNLDWWGVGEVRGSYAGTNAGIKDFVTNAGDNISASLEADIFYSHSHGRTDGILFGTKPDAGDPTKEVKDYFLYPGSDFSSSSDWNDDLDWAIIKACDVLSHNESGRGEWEALLEHSPRQVHGILSFEDPSISDYADYVDDFMDEIGARHTLISSWINANTASGLWTNQPYGIVYHTENADDRFRKGSEGISLTRDVTTSNFSYAWRDSGGQTGTDGLTGDIQETRKEMAIVWRGLKKTQEVRIGKAPNGLQNILVSGHHFETTELNQQFALTKKYESGMFKMSKDLNLNVENLSKEQAMVIANEFLEKLPLPHGAVMLEPEPLCLSKNEQDIVAIAYTVSFTHPYRGCVLAGDHLTLLVQSDGVKLVSAFWHDTKEGSGRHRIQSFENRDMKGAVEALRRFYPGIAEMPNVKYVRPVYLAFDPDISEPPIVWDVYFDNGKHVFWDGVAEEAPDYFKSQRKQTRALRQ